MILSGDLKDFSLADVLQLLLQQRKSGVLNLAHGRDAAELYISQGNLTGVRVKGAGPESKIREVLVESGRVGAKEMAELETIAADMNRPLLATLSAKGFVAEADADEWLQIISEDMVCDLFSWSGRYEFQTGLKGSSGLSHLNLSTEFACMEGMRRIDDWPRLHEKIPREKAVFQSTTKPYQGDELGWDRLVLNLVDGRRSVQQIGRIVPFGTFRLFECLVNLWNGGFIAPVDDATLEAEAPAMPEPESEKDRKTAMVLGISVLFFVCATAIRLVAMWMLGTGGPNPADVEAGVRRAMQRDNLEAFLIDHAARKDAFPDDPSQLSAGTGAPGPALRPSEISGFTGSRTAYKKVGEKGFILK
jgi:hypothetical protein